MKAKGLFVLVAALLSACVNQVEDSRVKNVGFKIGFEVSDHPFSRSLDDHIGTIEVFDYADGQEVSHLSQSASDNGFGSLQMELTFGKHSLVFVGHNSSECDYDGEYLSFDKVKDTFSATKELDVNEQTDTQEVTLYRQVAKVTITAVDAIPANAAKITVTIDQYSEKLQPKTGTGTAGIKHVREWTYGSDNIGETETNYVLYTFVPAEGHITDISIRVSDKDGNTIAERTQQDVPIHKNRNTRLKGKIFETGVATAFLVLSEWGDDVVIPM